MPLTWQLQRFCRPIENLNQNLLRRNEEAKSPSKGSARASDIRFNIDLQYTLIFETFVLRRWRGSLAVWVRDARIFCFLQENKS